MANQQVHIWVSGRVQGVFYRSFIHRRAETLGLTGYVRNLMDGRVEILAEGKKELLTALVSWARRGPSGARVDEVKMEWKEATNAGSSFEITW